jgi:outer membrane protein TolC
LRVAEQEARRSRIELAKWLPMDAERPLAAAPNFMELAVSAEQLLGNVHHHALVLAFDAQLEAAHTDIALAKAEKRPDWSVELDYAKRGREFSDMVSLEFRIGLPLFAGRRQDPVVAAKHARLRQIAAERETELRTHTADVAAQLSEWETLKSRFVAYESELVPLTRARADAALSAFKAAQTSVKPVLDARAAEIDAGIQAIELHGQLGRTWAFLSYLQNPKDLP